MKTLSRLFVLFLLLTSNKVIAYKTITEFPKLTGPYLGQKPPGMKPELFADSIFSSRYERFHTMICFSPDGEEVYWQAYEKKAMAEDPNKQGIYVSRIENGRWTIPAFASFSIRNNRDDAPACSPDGKRLYFLSARPGRHDENNGNEKIWVTIKTSEGWTNPNPLPSIVNSLELIHWGISVDRDYSVYFGVRPTMDLRDGYNGDIYYSRYANGQYSRPEKLSSDINIPGYKFSPYISADGNLLLFTHIGNKDDHYKILIGFRKKDGTWTKAKTINEVIGMNDSNIINPYVTPDGKYFFFSQIMNGQFPKPYWMNASFIEDLRKEELKGE